MRKTWKIDDVNIRFFESVAGFNWRVETRLSELESMGWTIFSVNRGEIICWREAA